MRVVILSRYSTLCFSSWEMSLGKCRCYEQRRLKPRGEKCTVVSGSRCCCRSDGHRPQRQRRLRRDSDRAANALSSGAVRPRRGRQTGVAFQNRPDTGQPAARPSAQPAIQLHLSPALNCEHGSSHSAHRADYACCSSLPSAPLPSARCRVQYLGRNAFDHPSQRTISPNRRALRCSHSYHLRFRRRPALPSSFISISRWPVRVRSPPPSCCSPSRSSS